MPYFGTDYGICSIIKPQIVFDPELEEMHFKNKSFGKHKKNIKKGAEVGRKNGLSILLDTETFDYSFHLKSSEGFKIAVHHHLDQPIMSIKVLEFKLVEDTSFHCRNWTFPQAPCFKLQSLLH